MEVILNSLIDIPSFKEMIFGVVCVTVNGPSYLSEDSRNKRT